MAVTLINTILLGVLIFTIVPTANRTTKLVDKVASIVDLEMESPENESAQVAVSDITIYDLPDKLTINLKKGEDGTEHYAMLNVSLSMNSKHKDFETLNPKVSVNSNAIEEIIQEEFAKYSRDEVEANKDVIKDNIITRIQELFQSDFIISVSFGNLILQ
jgi:flagellar FliL protein